MKDGILSKIVDHIDREEIVAKLSLNVSPQDINEWLTAKYGDLDGKKLVISVKSLKEFKDNYLNLYQKIQSDAIKLNSHMTISEQATDMVENNSAYKEKLAEYIDQEIDIKKSLINMTRIIESRIEQMYNIINENPRNYKPDYILVQYFNTWLASLKEANSIINGSPDTIIQQNNINIQVVDQHLDVFYKMVLDILSKLDYETSLHFMEMYSEGMKKLKMEHIKDIPVEIRLEDATRLNSQFSD